MKRNLVFFLICIQCALFQAVSASCPTPLPPLPQLPVPAIVPPPVATCVAPAPPSITGYLPITFVNNTKLLASEIYIAVLVNSSTQYLSFSGTSPTLATISNFTPSTYISSSAYSYPLDSFELLEADTYTFYIPNTGQNGIPGSHYMTSSRILISLKQPLTYFIDHNGLLESPSEFDPTSDTYYILNDKIEFDLGSNNLNRLNLNLTWVDFFGIPLSVQANYKFFYGTDFTNACSVTGMPSGITLAHVISQYNSSLSSLSPPFDTHWKGLVATYTNPNSDLCTLRIYAPATAMGSTQTQSNPSTVTFPTNYFLSSIVTNPECSWFNAVWKGKTLSGAQAYYQNQKPTPYLILDATTKKGAATATGNEGNDHAFRFSIAGGPDKGAELVFPEPTSSKAFFTGAVSDYAPQITANASSDTVAQVFKVFATSIIGGFFPINCQLPTPITINNTYVQSKSSQYFENNPALTQLLSGCSCTGNIPWYDFYSRILLTIGTPNLFYTSAYSDFLGTDGTIVIVNLHTNNAGASITVNLNDCSTGIHFSDPYSDTTTYNLTVGRPSNVSVEFATTEGGPFGPIPATAQGNALFLKVTYNAGFYSGQSFVTQIAPLVKVFHPILPGQGQIFLNGTNLTVSIGASPGG